MTSKLFIGNKKLDLFSDENIIFKSSITVASDITKNNTDFTQSFTVPASDNNNNIFKHYYNADIDGGFDARVKIDGRIELDGIPFKFGKWRLNGVKVKNGNPDSYNINFFGNLVSLKDLLGSDYLSDLDFSDYVHAYNDSNILTGLTSSLFAGDIIYTLLAKKQYYYDSDAGTISQENSKNIAFSSANIEGVSWRELRPSIKVLKIIEAIEKKYDITFSRDYFDTPAFNLYMHCDNENENLKNLVQIEFDNVGDVNTTDNVLNTTENTFTDANNDNVLVVLKITPSAGYENVGYRTQRFLNGVARDESKIKKGYSSTEFKTSGRSNTHTYFIRTAETFKFTLEFETFTSTGGAFAVINSYSALQSEQTISLDVNLSKLMPKIKTIDFLKGLFQKDKLIVSPELNGELYVNTIKDYYDNGSIIDATKYVDSNNYEVSRGDLLNEIKFKFEEPQTILNIEFESNNGIPYGDSETFLYDDNGTLLDGESLEIELPFEQVIYDRLVDVVDGEETNIVYGALIDDNLNPVTVKPHLFYNINTVIGDKPIGFIKSDNTLINLNTISTTINNPSHVDSNDNQLFSTVFNTEFNIFNGELIENTLYSNNYKDYILSIFNIKRRNYTFKAKNFPLLLLLDLSLNDVLKIKDSFYRIDNYEVNLLTGDITFKLINSFNNQLTT